MWPIVFLGIGVLWYLREQKKTAPPAAPAVDPNALIRQGMEFAMAQDQGAVDPGAPTDQGASGSGGSGGGGYADGGDQVSITSPVNPEAPSAPIPVAATGQRMTVPAAQAKLQTTSATQMASRLQAPMGSIAKRRVL